MSAGNGYPSGHWFNPPVLGLAYGPIVKTSFPELAVSFLDLSPWILLGTFSISLLKDDVTELQYSLYLWCYDPDSYLIRNVIQDPYRLVARFGMKEKWIIKTHKWLHHYHWYQYDTIYLHSTYMILLVIKRFRLLARSTHFIWTFPPRKLSLPMTVFHCRTDSLTTVVSLSGTVL